MQNLYKSYFSEFIGRVYYEKNTSKIIKDIVKAKYYSIFFNETTDVSETSNVSDILTQEKLLKDLLLLLIVIHIYSMEIILIMMKKIMEI